MYSSTGHTFQSRLLTQVKMYTLVAKFASCTLMLLKRWIWLITRNLNPKKKQKKTNKQKKTLNNHVQLARTSELVARHFGRGEGFILFGEQCTTVWAYADKNTNKSFEWKCTQICIHLQVFSSENRIIRWKEDIMCGSLPHTRVSAWLCIWCAWFLGCLDC